MTPSASATMQYSPIYGASPTEQRLPNPCSCPVQPQNVGAGMNPSDLTEVFRTRLGYTRSRLEVELFAADLGRSNLNLMDAALKEARAIAARAGPPRHARDSVIAIYNVKLAELAQLFPTFLVFESAYRAFTAARLAVAYGDDRWWSPVREAIAQGRNPVGAKSPGGIHLPRNAVDTVAHLLRGMGAGAAGVSTCYDLLEGGNLAHVERLIASHWTQIDGALWHDPARPKLTASGFGDLFRAVRKARNAAYHHRAVENRRRVVAMAEQLLDMLDVSLRDRLSAVGGAPLPPLLFGIQSSSRHG